MNKSRYENYIQSEEFYKKPLDERVMLLQYEEVYMGRLERLKYFLNLPGNVSFVSKDVFVSPFNGIVIRETYCIEKEWGKDEIMGRKIIIHDSDVLIAYYNRNKGETRHMRPDIIFYKEDLKRVDDGIDEVRAKLARMYQDYVNMNK